IRDRVGPMPVIGGTGGTAGQVVLRAAGRLFLKLAPVLAVAGFVVYAVWALYLEPLRRERERVEELRRAIGRLTLEERVAQIVVTGQRYDRSRAATMTTIRFVEVDADGDPIGLPREYTIEGDVAYFDGLVIKFEDSYVEKGDPKRGRALLLLRRIFGERQKPEDGFELDAVGSCPAPYRGSRPIGGFERELFARFWELALDPAKAKAAGVRVAQGEAVYKRMEPGKLYILKMRTTGELSLYVENLPAAVRDLHVAK
ncbi:MAG: hypothetical protein N3A38_06100, partial [Planctomycetota bacterium]|nr:hypothetical protein [Planctomycetota bacterium]